MIRLLFTQSFSSVSVRSVFHNATEIITKDPSFEAERNAKKEALKKDLATIDTLDLTAFGKADMLIRLSAWQSVSDQYDSSKRDRLTIPDNLMKTVEDYIKNGETSESIVDKIKVELMLWAVRWQVNQSKRYRDIQEPKPSLPNID